MRFPALESVQNDAIDKLAVAVKHWGNTYHFNCVCRMSKDSKSPQQKSPKIFQDKGMPLEFGCWALACRTASLWDEECKAPSQELSRAGSSSALRTCLFPSSWQSPLPSSAQHRVLGGTAPAPTDTRAGQAQAAGAGLREWEKTVTFALFTTQNWAAPHHHKKFAQNKANTEKNPTQKISESRLKMNISAWWVQDAPALALQGLQEAAVLFLPLSAEMKIVFHAKSCSA